MTTLLRNQTLPNEKEKSAPDNVALMATSNNDRRVKKNNNNNSKKMERYLLILQNERPLMAKMSKRTEQQREQATIE